MASSPPSTPAPSTNVKSAMRTLDIIEYVVAHGTGVVAQDIAGALAIPVSSLSYLLSTLAEREYLLREGRRYLPGPGLDRLRAPSATVTLTSRVGPVVRALRAEVDETVSFMMRKGWEIEAIVTEASAQALRYAIDPGHQKPLHCLAAGKAILAALPDAELRQYFTRTERVRFAPATLTSERELRAAITQIRAQGYAEAREEDTAGICGLACAAMIGGEVVGAFAVAVPAVRYDEPLKAKVVELLKRAAASVFSAD